MKSGTQLASFPAHIDLCEGAKWRFHCQCLETNTRTHKTQHTFHSCLAPPPCCPQGPILIPVCCTDLPQNTSRSLFLTLFLRYYLGSLCSLLLLSSLTSVIFCLLCFSSSTLSIFSPLQFVPPSFSPPSPFPLGSLPLSLPLSKLQRSPLSLCLREFNQSVKPRISTLKMLHKPCLVSDTPILANFGSRLSSVPSHRRVLINAVHVHKLLFYMKK